MSFRRMNFTGARRYIGISFQCTFSPYDLSKNQLADRLQSILILDYFQDYTVLKILSKVLDLSSLLGHLKF